MVSGLFSAKTVVHLSTTPATASFEHAVALCTETPALNASTTALIPRRVCIISSLICSANHQSSVGSHCSSREHPGTARRERPRRHCAAKQRDERATVSCRACSPSGPCRAPQNAAYRTPKLPRKHRQVLGVDLNCSESRRWPALKVPLPDQDSTWRAALRP